MYSVTMEFPARRPDPRGLHLRHPFGQFLQRQHFASVLVEVRDTDPVFLPAACNFGLEVGFKSVGGREAAAAPLLSRRDLPASSRVDEYPRPLAGAVFVGVIQL